MSSNKCHEHRMNSTQFFSYSRIIHEALHHRALIALPLLLSLNSSQFFDESHFIHVHVLVSRHLASHLAAHVYNETRAPFVSQYFTNLKFYRTYCSYEYEQRHVNVVVSTYLNKCKEYLDRLDSICAVLVLS